VSLLFVLVMVTATDGLCPLYACMCVCVHQALEVMLGLKMGTKPGDEDMAQAAAAAEQEADSAKPQQASATAAASSSGGGAQQQHQQQANGTAQVCAAWWLHTLRDAV
jgi:hypothetical protein